MGIVSFSVSARTAKLIGQENFATAEGAIIELVKNCYDADAKNCLIIFDNSTTNKGPVLYIVDNGVGMTSNVIENQWMQIGTDDKLSNYESVDGRIKTGAKGIGRFALDRLGLKSEMWTVSKETGQGSYWSVQWSDFDRSGITIDQVQAQLNDIPDLDIRKELLQRFSSVPAIFKQLNDIEFASGTLLAIYPLKDRWDEAAVTSLFDNLEVLIPPQEQPDFVLHLYLTSLPSEFGKVNSAYYDDFDYKVSAHYLANKDHALKITISRNELDVVALEKNYDDLFKRAPFDKPPYDLKTFQNGTFEINTTVTDFSGFSKVDLALLAGIGEFTFTYYFLKNTIDVRDREKFPYIDISVAARRSWLQKFGGVKIFRDEFRVRPYGEPGQDWLKLGERQAKSPGGPGQRLGGYRIGPNQIAGTVKISRIANATFQDKSGREGIQENETFDLFRNLLIELIGIFERDRNVIMFGLSSLAKQRLKDEADKAAAKELADAIILAEQEAAANAAANDKKANDTPPPPESEGNSTPPTANEIILAHSTKMFEQEIDDKNDEIKLLRGLASVGLIISSFAHELKGLRSRLIPRGEVLMDALHKYLDQGKLSGIKQIEHPIHMLSLIRDEDVKLKHWLDYSLTTLKRDKRNRRLINFGEYFENFDNSWKMALMQRKINLKLIGTKDPQNVIMAFEVDLDSIFNNLLSNSLNAFKDRKGAYQRQLTIKWSIQRDYIDIFFTDNGVGLAKEYVKEPEKIFEFNESSKRDRTGNQIGTGMGLYIAKLVIADYKGAEINVQPESQGVTMKIKFLLRKRTNDAI